MATKLTQTLLNPNRINKIMETDLTQDSFKDTDEKTAFYTALPKFLVFLQVLKLCEAFVQSTATKGRTIRNPGKGGLMSLQDFF